jgi:lipoprotein-anchoring transpeptidase ErfK/SrfK
MSQHRRDVRPRYGRITALVTSVLVSGVAALGGLGLVGGSASAGAAAKPASYHERTTPSSTPDPGATPITATQPDGSSPAADASSSPAAGASFPDASVGGVAGETHSEAADPTALPADSGSGRRIVFDQSAQRVWLVGAKNDDVQRTYLVSGSVTHNLQPGTYSVYSKSRWAVGVDDSGVMQYFVRFTRGPTGAAIGFHSIPTKNHEPLQTKAQLGTPQSHGCIRQNLPDAIALWNFAPEGTRVVVVA